ncbi:unnamed protein product [Rhizoctonia solani]|uniref:Uncharacterized protein n=1 Tax=Rhizoctonia solani TaxID=456999 RepID=A0A8H3AR21_9AGAM|nr:unnamed protein product [Rhizoctonia solani]
MSPRVLFVYTSANKTLTGSPTGWWMSEAAHLYYLLQGKVEIDFASPKGPNPPLREKSPASVLEFTSNRRRVTRYLEAGVPPEPAFSM